MASAGDAKRKQSAARLPRQACWITGRRPFSCGKPCRRPDMLVMSLSPLLGAPSPAESPPDFSKDLPTFLQECSFYLGKTILSGPPKHLPTFRVTRRGWSVWNLDHLRVDRSKRPCLQACRTYADDMPRLLSVATRLYVTTPSRGGLCAAR